MGRISRSLSSHLALSLPQTMGLRSLHDSAINADRRERTGLDRENSIASLSQAPVSIVLLSGDWSHYIYFPLF